MVRRLTLDQVSQVRILYPQPFLLPLRPAPAGDVSDVPEGPDAAHVAPFAALFRPAPVSAKGRSMDTDPLEYNQRHTLTSPRIRYATSSQIYLSSSGRSPKSQD